LLFYKKIHAGVMSLLLALLVTACSIGSPETEVAQKAVDGFYQAQQQQDLEKALTFYSNKRTPEEWRSHLQHLRDALGSVQGYSLKHTEVNTVLSGRFYIFEYQVNYSSGKGAKETLTLFDSVEADDTPLIASHAIMAEGFNPLFQ
jgi:hypothetical protein